MEYYRPEYVHTFEMDEDHIAFFNALSLDIVYCKKQLVKIYNDGKILPDKSISDALNKFGMIVNEMTVSDQLIEQNINKYANYILSEKINFLYIVPTVSCNLNCTYCHIQYEKEHRKNIVMSNDTLVKGLNIFKKYGGFDDDTSEIMFYGGEPFLAVDFIKNAMNIIRSYSSTIRITFFSNGTLITDEIADVLKKNDAYVIISLDGRKDSHNRARKFFDGRDSFDDVSKGYMCLKEKGVKLGVSLVVGSHNIENLDEEVMYITEKFVPLDIGISTLHLFPNSLNPNEVDIKILSKNLENVYKTMREHGVYVEHLFRRIRPFVEQKARIYDCPSCNSKLLITPWDTIGFCEAFMEDENFFYSTNKFDLYVCPGREKWKNRIPLMKRNCYKCPAISICGGGCPYDAYCENGDISSKDKRRCYQSITMIKWLCKDLFYLIKTSKMKEQSIYVPTKEDRKSLYGNVFFDDIIPLQNYSNSNELYFHK